MRRGFDGLSALGTNQVGTESIIRTRVCVPWPAWRFDQSAMVRWRWAMSIFETTGAWAFRVATSQQRERGLDAGTVVDVAGRH